MTSPRAIRRRTLLAGLGAGAAALASGSCAGGGSNGSGGNGSGGGGNGGSGGGGGDTFDVWVLQEDSINPVSRASLERFNADSKVNGKLVVEPNEGYRDAVQISIDTPQRPDVMFNWGGGSIRAYVRAGLLEDLTPHLDEDPDFKNAFLPSVLDAGKIDDAYYGIPMRTMQPKLMFYNTDVLDEAGVAAPTNWQEFLDACDAIKAAGITPVSLAGAVTWTELMWFEYIADRIGGEQVFLDIAAGTGEGWRHPAIAQTVDTIRDLVDRGVFGTAFSSVQYEAGGAETLLEQGRAGMHLMGSWAYTNHLNADPDFAANQLAWGPFPPMPDGAGHPDNIAGNPTNYFSVTSASEHKAVAIEYLKQEMASENYVKDLIDVGDVPAVADIEGFLADHENAEYITYIYDMVVKAPSFQLSWDQAIERELAEPMLNAMEEVFLGKMDAEGFIKANEDAAG